MSKPKIYQGKTGIFYYYSKKIFLELCLVFSYLLIYIIIKNIWLSLIIWVPLVIYFNKKYIKNEATQRAKLLNKPYYEIMHRVISEILFVYIHIIMIGIIIFCFYPQQ